MNDIPEAGEDWFRRAKLVLPSSIRIARKHGLSSIQIGRKHEFRWRFRFAYRLCRDVGLGRMIALYEAWRLCR